MIKKLKIIFKAIKKISRLKPYVIIARATPNWPCALIKILFKKYPLIYFPYDIRSIGLENKESAKKFGIKKFELKAERFCFENADGIIHKGHPEELKYIREEVLGKNLKINSPIIAFHPYCSEEFMVPLNKNKISKKDKEIHTVYIGSMGAEGFSSDNYIIKCVKKIIENKIHVHVYTKSNTLSIDKAMNFLLNDFKDITKSKYFHLHKPLGPKKIIKEISKYDFGLLLVSEPTPKDFPEKKGGYGMGNKNASYLEAGIPCIHDYGVVFIGQLMKKYSVGFPLGDLEDIPKLKEKLKKINYKKIEKNIIKAREDFLMKKHLLRLERFIEKVAENHSKSYKDYE